MTAVVCSGCETVCTDNIEKFFYHSDSTTGLYIIDGMVECVLCRSCLVDHMVSNDFKTCHLIKRITNPLKGGSP